MSAKREGAEGGETEKDRGNDATLSRLYVQGGVKKSFELGHKGRKRERRGAVVLQKMGGGEGGGAEQKAVQARQWRRRVRLSGVRCKRERIEEYKTADRRGSTGRREAWGERTEDAKSSCLLPRILQCEEFVPLASHPPVRKEAADRAIGQRAAERRACGKDSRTMQKPHISPIASARVWGSTLPRCRRWSVQALGCP